MNAKYFIIAIGLVNLLAIKGQAQEEEIKGGIFVETEKYYELVNLEPPEFPEGVAKNINYIHVYLMNQKDKIDDSPYYVTDGGTDEKQLNSVYFSQPTASSSAYYESRASDYSSMASNSSDPSRRSYYSGMAQTYSSAAQNQMMIQQSFDRAINTVQMYNAISNTMSALASALYKKWIISDMNNAIHHGFGTSELLYSQNESDPELILIFIAEGNVPKKAPFYYRLILEAKVKYNDEIISLPSQSLIVKHFKKKYLEDGLPEGFVNQLEADPPMFHPGIVKNYWYYNYFGIMLRQTAHDYKELKEALLGNSK